MPHETALELARVSALLPKVNLGNVQKNAQEILELWQRSDDEGCTIAVSPELGLTGYTLRDLLFDRSLLEDCEHHLLSIAEHSEKLHCALWVGLPLRIDQYLFNVGALVQQGKILGIVPKTFLPNGREFEEKRWFRSALELPPNKIIKLGEHHIPVGTNLLFQDLKRPDFIVSAEICEDAWVPFPPSAYQVAAGATLVCNLSASDFVTSKRRDRTNLVRALSERQKCAYVYTSSGIGESSSDLVFEGDALIFENGEELASSPRFQKESVMVIADIDLVAITQERLTHSSFGDCMIVHRRPSLTIPLNSREAPKPHRRSVSSMPFLPLRSTEYDHFANDIIHAQTQALVTRLSHTRSQEIILGISGGLDSSLAALVAARCLDELNFSRQNLQAVFLASLGSGTASGDRAQALSQTLGADFSRYDLNAQTVLALEQLRHPATEGIDAKADTQTKVDFVLRNLKNHPNLVDAAFENIQARLRTTFLMTLANQRQGIMIGTSDLSEEALGFSTYGGDHLSMYDINAGLPKTVVNFLLRWAGSKPNLWTADEKRFSAVVEEILATPISPELIPLAAAAEGQHSESLVGPYELHDFFLYHMLRNGSGPMRILDLATIAFHPRHGRAQIKHWLHVFYRRFFANQFKRSASADGPKMFTVGLSPRGDWRMPSDADVTGWLAALDRA